MKKITLGFILVVAFILTSVDVKAQLSERVNNPSTFRTGTRPTQGAWGFSVSYSLADNDALKGDAAIESFLPLVTIKHYWKDNIVLSLGFQSMKTSKSISGDLNPDENGGLKHYEWKDVTAKKYLRFGVEKHFLATNLLDPFISVSIPLGYWRESKGSKSVYTSGETSNLKSRFSFYYGFELSVGTKIFIADLPIAIGIEAGATGYGLMGDKYKVEGTNSAGDSYTYYTTNLDDSASGMKFESLSSHSYQTGGFARVSISYYFR